MNLVRYRRGKRRSCVAALTLLATSFFAAQETTHPSNQLDQTQRTIRDLARKFTEILAPTPIETQLQAKCAVNCSGVRDSKTGLTVAQELENIEARKRIEMAGVASEIQRFVDDYIATSVSASKESLDGRSVIKNLSHILSGVADPPPMAFVLGSRQIRALLIFDNIQNGTMGVESSYAALTAFNVDGAKLVLSDSTGSDMNGYGGIDVKELHSPAQNQIWLLFSGRLTGANGPNCRMRVFAYDGQKFRIVWAPPNVWGNFTTQVTQDGFVVSGDYYKSNQRRLEKYHVAADGLYQIRTDH